MEIKIVCDCGQKYIFSVDPENGRLPVSVNCPACGADGTKEADEILSQIFPEPAAEPVVETSAPPPAAAAGSSPRINAPATAQSQQLPAPLPIKLRACPEYGKDVSIRAEVCPHCGAPFVEKKNTSGLGCPNCGSQNIYQRTHSSGAGIGLFIGGLVLAFFTFGIGLVLCVIAVFLNEKRGHCRDCKWAWKT